MMTATNKKIKITPASGFFFCIISPKNVCHSEKKNVASIESFRTCEKKAGNNRLFGIKHLEIGSFCLAVWSFCLFGENRSSAEKFQYAATTKDDIAWHFVLATSRRLMWYRPLFQIKLPFNLRAFGIMRTGNKVNRKPKNVFMPCVRAGYLK